MPLRFSRASRSRTQRRPLQKATEDPILIPADAGLTQVERAFVLLFAEAMSRVATTLVPERLKAAFARLNAGAMVATGDVDEAIRVVIEDKAIEEAMTRLRDGSADLFQREIVRGGKISANVPKKITGSFAFDVADERAIIWAESQAGALIREISTETREAINKIVTDALRGGYSGDDAAEMIARIVGLNSRQTTAVENLYQTTVKNLLDDGVKPSTAKARARQMADEYRSRLIERRGQMIARTEIMRAANNGRMLAWAQASDDGLLAAGTLKEWRTYPGFGARGPCPICLDLRGSTVGVFEDFPNGILMPPAHPFCRCTAILVPPSRGLPRITPVGAGYAKPPTGAQIASALEFAKFNPHHDKRGRFARKPGSATPPASATLPATDVTVWKANPRNTRRGAKKVLETDKEEMAQYLKDHPKDENGYFDVYVTESEMYGDSAMSPRTEASLGYNALLAAHRTRETQPELYRGLPRPLAEGEGLKAGDTFDLTPSGFSSRLKVAADYYAVDYDREQVATSPTLIRVRPGARGVRVPNRRLGSNEEHEDEVIVQGKFRIVGISTTRDDKRPDVPVTVIDVEQIGTYDPDTGGLLENAGLS